MTQDGGRGDGGSRETRAVFVVVVDHHSHGYGIGVRGISGASVIGAVESRVSDFRRRKTGVIFCDLLPTARHSGALPLHSDGGVQKQTSGRTFRRRRRRCRR